MPNGVHSDLTLSYVVNGHTPLAWTVPWYQSSSRGGRNAVSCYNVANKLVFEAAWLKEGRNELVLQVRPTLRAIVRRLTLIGFGVRLRTMRQTSRMRFCLRACNSRGAPCCNIQKSSFVEIRDSMHSRCLAYFSPYGYAYRCLYDQRARSI